MSAFTDGDRAAITAARLLAMDAVQHAGSGHPGTAMALAPVAHLLYQRHLRHDPADPHWIGRDRFVLSCGHASILQYVQLYLTGYDLDLDDLKAFRRLGSRTPGHPEYGHTAGVETTTGPLGQGVATAVGIAMGFAHERALYDPNAPEGESPFDRRVFVLCSDGDLQEGVSAEAAALAGHHKLGNLVVIYDDNDIQIEGAASLAQSEDVATRFRAQGWHVQTIDILPDGDVDASALDEALIRASGDTAAPNLVILRSQIAWPAPNARNKSASHGAPLGEAEVAATRELLAPCSEAFEIPEDVLATTRQALVRGERLRTGWSEKYASWIARAPEAEALFTRARTGALPLGVETVMPTWQPGEALATRDASGAVIQALAGRMPELWGGSADLAEPNRTGIRDGGSFLPSSREGRNVHWGVREHAMAAAMNGILLAGGSRIFGGTFLVFSDYQRPAIRLAALMGLPTIHLYSHDSVALGADGPTHQPIEHLASLRAIPGLAVVRPADANETAAAWLAVLETRTPSALVLARQPVAVADVSGDAVREGVRRGGYVVREADDPAVVLVATGSEVSLALEASSVLEGDGVATRVVSLPSREWFLAQPPEYREQVLPSQLPRVGVEAATSFGWSDLLGTHGRFVGIDSFGLSAPADDALREKGMTVERVVHAVRDLINDRAVALAR